jgi:hypothetical protein
MFDIGTKIKRAWNTVWHYKVLWIFAFLMVLTGASGGGGGGGGGGSTSSWRTNMNDHYSWNADEMGASAPAWLHQFGNWMENDVTPLFTPDRLVNTIVWMVVILFAIGLVIGLLSALVRYPAETAVLRMVNDYEENGTKVKFKQGWKLGWNRRAFRLWLIDLIIGAPAFVVFAGLAVGIAVFVSNMISREALSQIPGMIGLIILAGFLFLVLAIVMVFVGLWREFISRAIAIDDAGVGEAFKQGWGMIAHNSKNAFLTWLVMLGLGIGFGIAFFVALIVLIPAFAVMTIPGTIVAAIPGAIAFGITSIFTSGPLVWVIAALVFIGFFFTVVFAPASLVNGLYMIFSSSIWTQTYREMKRGNQPPVVPVVEEMTSNQ